MNNSILLFILLIINVIELQASSCAIKHPDGFTTVLECPKGEMVVLFDEPSAFVIALKNGVVVNEGGIVTADGKILSDTETYRRDQQRLLQPQRDIANEDPLFYHGRLAVISSPGSENWYHWLLQVLPRLLLLKLSNITYDQIYIANLKYPWQKESLHIVMSSLGISEEKLFLVQGDSIVQAETLIVSSIPHIPSMEGVDSFPQWLKDFLRETFLPKDEVSTPPKKIYVSRAKATIRKIKNEQALIKLLKNKGFKVVYLEEMPIKQQAHLFRHAEIIVGPHGSGFTNLIFCQPGTQIVEIDHGLPGDDQRSFYKSFARFLRCPYHPFYVDTVDEDDLEKDMHVELSTFDQFLQTILEE